MLDKIKQLGKDTAVYGISTILGRFLNFLLIPLYSNLLPVEENGMQGTIYAIIGFLNVIYIYGMEISYLKFSSVNEENQKKYFSTSFNLVFITSLFFSAIMFLLKDSVAGFSELTGNYYYLINYMAGILFIDAITVIPFTFLRLKRKSMLFSMIKTGNIFINITLNIILIVFLKKGLEAVLISNIIASLFSLIFLLPVIKSNLSCLIDFSELKRMIRFGIFFLPAALSSMIVQVFDRPILAKLSGQYVNGLYTQNYRLGIFMMLFVSMFQFAWQPFLLDNAKEENAKSIFSKVLTLFLFLSAIIWVVLTLFIEDLVKIPVFGFSLLKADFWQGLGIVPVILMAYIFNGLYINFSAGILIKEKTYVMPVVTLAGAIINIGINIVYIPVWGMWAAAAATLASYVVMAAILFFFAQKYYKINYEYSRIAKIFITIVIIGGCYYSLDYLWIKNIFTKLLLLFVFPILIIIFKIYTIKDFKHIISIILRRK